MKRALFLMLLCGLLCQCHSLRSDCKAIREREAIIAQEATGDYYIGRRYYIPNCRFWGYLRRPGQSWRTAKLVMMDESLTHTPDRGPEPPLENATFGTDANVEYIVHGAYTGDNAYDPSTDQILPVFRANKYEVKDKEPGFLFKPSEKYSENYVTLQPGIMPTPQICTQALSR